MSDQERKLKYEEYAEKLEQTRMDINEDMNWSGVKFKTDDILDQIRQKGDSVEFNIIILILAIPLSILALVFIYSYSVWMGLLGLVIVISYMIYYRMEMRNVIAENSSKKITSTERTLSEVEQIRMKIDYINSGIEIKKKRIHLIRLFYMICFPILLYMGTAVISGGFEGRSTVAAFLMAFIVGSVFWAYYFKPDLEDLEYTQDELLEQTDMLT